MFVAQDKQETVINFSRIDKDICLYTSDRTWMTKLDRLVKELPDLFHVVEENEISKKYVFPKKLLTIRKGVRKYSEEQRAQMAERMRVANSRKTEQT